MRTIIAVATLALLTVPAYSQDMLGGKKHHRTEQKADEQKDKKKVDEKAYNDALSRIPTSNEKPDPWRKMR